MKSMKEGAIQGILPLADPRVFELKRARKKNIDAEEKVAKRIEENKTTPAAGEGGN